MLLTMHGTQNVEEFLPAVPENVPAAQAVHVADVSWPVWIE